MMRRLLALVLGAVVLVACSSTPSDPEPAPLPPLPADRLRLERLWQVDVGNGLGGQVLRLVPAVGAQQVVAANQDGRLVAVNADDGKVIWRVRTGQPLSGGPAQGYGLVVVGTSKGQLLAHDAATGSPRWQATLGAAVLAVPALSADTVVVMSADGVVHALERADGQVRWTYRLPVPPLSLRGGPAPLVEDGVVLVPTPGGKVVALDLATGVVIWDVRVASNSGRSELERMVDIQGDLLLGSNGDLYAAGFQSQLTALDVQAGRRRWQYDLSTVNSLAEGLGSIYVSDTGSTVLSIDAGSGKLVWRQPALAWRGLGAPVVLGDVLVLGDADGWLHLLAQSDGRVRGRERAQREPVQSLAVAGDRLYVWSADGRLSAWRLR